MDGGQTWELPFDGGDGFHGGMAISADGSKLFLGSEFGAWLATDLTNANLTLTNLNPTLATSLLLGTAIHPTNPDIGLAGSQSNGVDCTLGQCRGSTPPVMTAGQMPLSTSSTQVRST